MSVINKMLRDLDQRSASTLDPALRAGTRMAAKPATISSHNASRTRAVLWGVAGLVLLVLGGAAWWWSPLPSTSSLHSAEAGVSGAAESSTAVVPLAPAPAASAPQSVVAGQIPAAAPKAASLPDAPVPLKASKGTSLPDVAPKTASAKVDSAGLQLSSSLFVSWPAAPPLPGPSGGTPVAALPAPAGATVGPDPAVTAQRQQNATREVLAQAQTLYSSGSAEAAMQLLQDSLQTAERASPPAPAAMQLQLMRELARMELAQGRASAVLELLSRMEPLMAGQPELWAVRANAAQRLGRHQDAVLFYANALQSRPAEQRWLLGGAVSQAALGQVAIAAEMAEKARAIAPVSKEVLTYLRQQGVTLADKP